MNALAWVSLPVPDLGEARMAWTRLGFTLGPRWREPGTGVSAETVLFAAGRLHLGPRMAVGIAGTLRGGEEVMRQIELPQETIVVRARREIVPGLPVVLWEERDGLPQKPEWLDHPNGAIALAGVVLPVAAAPVERLAALFGPAAVNTTDEVATVHLGAAALTLAGAEDLMAMYPELEGPAPVVRIRMRDLEAAADCLADWRVECAAAPGRLLVPPDEASGVLLELVRA